MAEEELHEEETPFNMAMMYYMELHELRRLKSKAVINNDMYSYFDCLEEIYISISFKLKKEEKDKIEADFKKAREQFNNQGQGSTAHQIQFMSLNNIKVILKGIDMELINLMHRYRMIFPRIETGGFKKLNERYGLGGDKKSG